MTIILHDTDLADPSCMITAIAAVENFMLAHAHGKTVSPPRHHVAFSNYGDLVFTIGGNMDDKPLAGFRVYDTFAGSGQTQLVAVWAVDSGQLKGLVLGTQLGALRTGAIGGVAIRYLSDPNAQSIGIIGSGLQARTQLAAALAVRNIKTVRVYSRTAEKCEAFASYIHAAFKIDCQAVASVQEAVREADIVICATTSLHPVLHGVDIKPGAHVNSVGPKTQAGHELGIDIAAMAGIIATDSREQCQNYAAPFFLHGSGHEQRLVELADIIVGRLPGRGTTNTNSLFCSVGLAGTDVAVASALLDQVWFSNNSRTSL